MEELRKVFVENAEENFSQTEWNAKVEETVVLFFRDEAVELVVEDSKSERDTIEHRENAT